MTVASLTARLAKLEERSNAGLAVVFLNERRPGYPEAVAYLERLQAMGRRVIIYKNSFMANTRPSR